ncbi:ATP-binding protein [Streptomyces sp. 549]|uniref:ATP-binding protein n=1 Tax=Streptomyces sp. 549 TaxID=3049076 RepID=UPI0024C4315F|nr:ATP-binding protein [Streptomyces sp. 549]MDK1476121.1 ATP-binding protein [Streptomyces sp. 549]
MASGPSPAAPPAAAAGPAPVAGPAATSGFAAWTLESGPRSAGQARRFAHSALTGWGMEELGDSVAVSVSEMVTNALSHSACPWENPLAQPVLLSLLRQGGTVLCAVIDSGTAAPAVREAGELAESGRGLHIVDCLSDDWGWTDPGPFGKAVWARFSRLGDPCAPPGDLPDAEWDPLTRLLLLTEILGGSGPGWLDTLALQPTEGRTAD